MVEPMPTVTNDMVVTIDYVLTLEDGDMVESTKEGMPLRFLAGHDEILPGLEEALAGMAVGDETAVTLEPEDGYGDYDPEAFEEVPVDQFPATENLEPGMPIGVQDASGEMYQAFIAEVRPDTIVLDFNHPLAGETLHFQVKVIDLRAGHGGGAGARPHARRRRTRARVDQAQHGCPNRETVPASRQDELAGTAFAHGPCGRHHKA